MTYLLSCCNIRLFRAIGTKRGVLDFHFWLVDVSFADVESRFVRRIVVVVRLDSITVSVVVPVRRLPVLCAGGLFQSRDQGIWVRRVAAHVAPPFACAPHVFLGQAVVFEEGAFDQRVDPALQQVAGTRHGTARQQPGVQEREELALPEQSLEPAVAAAQFPVRPPPFLPGGLGIGGIVLRPGAFGDEIPPPPVPRVQRTRPLRGLPGRPDGGQGIGQFLELPARLEPGPGRQVGAGVALHVHQAALDPRARPGLGAGPLDAAEPVRDEDVGRRYPREQRGVRGGGLVPAPLECHGFAGQPVDGYEQTPAMGHVRAVGHDDVADDAVRRYGRAEAPAPADALAERPPVRPVHVPLAFAGQQPVEEFPQLRAPAPVTSRRRRGKRASRAFPSLRPRLGPAVLPHRPAAYRAQARPFRFRPHGTMQPQGPALGRPF